MELTMTNGFSELSYGEMEMVDGGGGPWDWANGFVKGLTGHTMEENCYHIGRVIQAYPDRNKQGRHLKYPDVYMRKW